MKINAGVFIAAVVLTGCAQNPLAKNDADSRAASAQAASTSPTLQAQSATSQAQASAPVLPPCVDAAPSRAAVANSKKSNVKGKQAAVPKEPVAATPCARPGTTPAPVAAAVVPAAPTQAASATSAAKREVKGMNDWTGYIQGTPAPNSRFSNLKIGMGQKEAMDIAGPPTDQGAHITGKAFIPFYMGSGSVETWLHYKGIGRLLFASNGGFSSSTGLIGIEHDANERGYR